MYPTKTCILQLQIALAMSQPEDMSTGFHRSAGPKISVSREVMVGMAVAILLVVVVILFVILYPYAKRVLVPNRALSRRRSRLVFAVTDPVSTPCCGLSSTVLKALPVTVFHVSEEELVCAVCLRQLNDGEQVRILPKCNHGFHLECIDMWFQSHSTCPLCRNPVEINLTPNSSTEEIPATVAVSVGDFPSNMHRGEDRIISAAEKTASSSVSASVKREGMLVIDIPRLRMEEFLLSSTSLPTSETSKTPTSVRRRTLTRFLSVGNSTTGFFSASPGEIRGDIEQGKRGHAVENWRVSTPRIPRNS